MSCEKGPNQVTRLAGQISAGIGRLAGKRAFYAGLAVGASGAVSALALARAIRRRRENGRVGPVLGNSTRATVQESRPGARTRPQKIPPAALRELGSRTNPKKIPVLAVTPADTKLQAATVRIQTGNGQAFTPKNSYRVVRPDGSETGLAITPYVRTDDNGQPVEDEQRWGVTHASSGSLISGPYDSVAQAQGLATQLAGLGWTEARVPPEDVQQARQIISAYQAEKP